MEESKFNEILQKMREEFTSHIMSDLYDFHYYDEITELLKIKMYSRNFYYQHYIVKRGETYIRDYLLNGVLCNAFEQNGIKVQIIQPSDVSQEKFSNIRNYEKKSGFEFIVEDQNEKIGVRYSLFDEDDMSSMNKYRIDKLVIIRRDLPFAEESNYYEYYMDPIEIDYPCTVIGLGSYIIAHFGEENAFNYIRTIRETIKEYLKTVGVSSLPRLTPPVLSEFRINKEKVLTSKASQISSFFRSFFENDSFSFKRYKERFPNAEIKMNTEGIGYKVFMEKELNEKDYKNLEERTRELFQKYNIIDEFFDKKYYKALVGSSDIAKSFLTSEFLFSQYNGSDLIDYTPIISGYVKSIEQLMFKIIVIALFNGDPEKFGDQETTMDTLCKFFRNNTGIYKNKDKKIRKTIKDCLYCYKKECRNNNFHKHNIYNWNQVKIIRDNTLILYVMLFGGCYLGKNDEEVKSNFQIVDDQLERIYNELRKIPLKINEFYIKLKDEDYSVKCVRKIETSFPKYDKNGFLIDFSILFECIDEDHPELNKKIITITRDNIPDEIVYFWNDEPEWLEY